jgi:hypothetical protein
MTIEAPFILHTSIAILLACGAACDASAQTSSTRIDHQRGAELALFGGAARVSGGVSPSFGWSLAWLPSSRVAIEGSGSWIDEPGVDGFAALFGPRVYLNTSGRAVTFVTAEAGLYHASADRSHPRTADFYVDRTIPGSPTKAFNDFVAAFGGGVDLQVRGRVWMRPHVRVLTVVDGWQTHRLAVIGLHVSYKFTQPSSGP